MEKKNILLLVFLFSAFSMFSQKSFDFKSQAKTESQSIYLDSIKKTFIKHQLACSVDSLWLKELTSLEAFTSLSEDIKNINFDEKIDYDLSTDLLKKRLAEMDAKSPFNIEYNAGLENIIKSFLKNRKNAFGRLMAISEYYFPMFEEALSKYNVPLEIKYLAIVESALNPKAVSKMGATGLWQFMYQTGKQYNLKIDSYIDERSDPLKSSEAAAQYMSKMYEIFGDWDLVLASYNSGPGNVAKAIRRSNGQQNYWNIRKNLPKETQGYVPAFLATMYLYEYRKEHGIKPEKALIKHFDIDTIQIKKQMSFTQVSDLLDIPVAQLQLLNPSYKMGVFPYYNDENHFLRLPKDKIAIFTSNEDKIYAYIQRDLDMREKPFQTQNVIVIKDSTKTEKIPEINEKVYYVVKQGDNLNEIAKKYNITIDDLKNWNNLNGYSIAVGKSLIVNKPENEAIIERKNAKTSVEQKSNSSIASLDSKSNKENKILTKIKKTDAASTQQDNNYIVQKGDNLNAIAKKNKVSVADLMQWNNLSNTSIQLGMAIQVCKIEPNENESIVENIKFENVEYIVKKGDNLSNISKKFGSTIEDLKQWNNLTDTSISIGNSLVVAKTELKIEEKTAQDIQIKNQSFARVTKSKTIDYLVKKGDSLYSISKKHPGVTISDIKKWNNISNEELRPGMKLKING